MCRQLILRFNMTYVIFASLVNVENLLILSLNKETFMTFKIPSAAFYVHCLSVFNSKGSLFQWSMFLSASLLPKVCGLHNRVQCSEFGRKWSLSVSISILSVKTDDTPSKILQNSRSPARDSKLNPSESKDEY